MINWDVNRIKRRLSLLSVAIALVLAGCAQPSASASGYGGSTPGGSDPYHYRCTGNCQAGS